MARTPATRAASRSQAGFTLLEVLVALAILGIAVVTLIELASQSLRLVKRSGDYQEAVQLADRLVRDTVVTDPVVDTGQEGVYNWERRVTLIALPEEMNAPLNTQGLQPTRAPFGTGARPTPTQPGQPASATQNLGAELPQLFAVEIAVRWGGNQSLQLATLMTSATNDPMAATAPTGGLSPTAQTPGGPTPAGSQAQSTEQSQSLGRSSGKSPQMSGSGSRMPGGKGRGSRETKGGG